MQTIQEVHHRVEIAINVAAVVRDPGTDAVKDRDVEVAATHCHAVLGVGDLHGIVRIVNKRGNGVREGCPK
jgi:hypothetical protein